MGKLLCKLGLHRWLLVYEDDIEQFYSCRRYQHCDGEYVRPKTGPSAAGVP